MCEGNLSIEIRGALGFLLRFLGVLSNWIRGVDYFLLMFFGDFYTFGDYFLILGTDEAA